MKNNLNKRFHYLELLIEKFPKYYKKDSFFDYAYREYNNGDLKIKSFKNFYPSTIMNFQRQWNCNFYFSSYKKRPFFITDSDNIDFQEYAFGTYKTCIKITYINNELTIKKIDFNK